MTPSRKFLMQFTATPQRRYGNKMEWVVSGGTLAQPQTVVTHVMCGRETAILKALKQEGQ